MTPPIGAGSRSLQSEPTRRVIRGTAAFTAGAILQRAVVFILLPFFARVLSPEEFGQIGVITTIAAAVTVITSLGLETAVFRGYKRAYLAHGHPARFVNTVGAFALLVPAALAAIFALVGASSVARAVDVPVDALQLASIGAAAFASATIVPLALLRAQERLRDYLQLTALQVAVTPILTILFVAVLGWGVTGWMLAYAISGAFLLLRGLAILRHRWSSEFDIACLRAALVFGIPLVPHALAHWGLSVSDRVILAASVTAAEVGAYYVAYLFCLPVTLVAIALSQATQPLYAEAGVSEIRRHEVGQIITVQAVIVLLTAAAVILVGPAVSLLALPDGYSSAADLIPWLALGTCLFGLYLMPMNVITLLKGQTSLVWIITVLAAAANIGLNLLLVPRFGTIAAAINTMIGYGALLLGIYVYARGTSDAPIPFDGRRIAIAAVLILVAVVAAGISDPRSPSGLAIRIAGVTGVSAAILFGLFKEEAGMAWRAIRPTRLAWW